MMLQHCHVSVCAGFVRSSLVLQLLCWFCNCSHELDTVDSLPTFMCIKV